MFSPTASVNAYKRIPSNLSSSSMSVLTSKVRRSLTVSTFSSLRISSWTFESVADSSCWFSFVSPRYSVGLFSSFSAGFSVCSSVFSTAVASSFLAFLSGETSPFGGSFCGICSFSSFFLCVSWFSGIFGKNLCVCISLYSTLF